MIEDKRQAEISVRFVWQHKPPGPHAIWGGSCEGHESEAIAVQCANVCRPPAIGEHRIVKRTTIEEVVCTDIAPTKRGT